MSLRFALLPNRAILLSVLIAAVISVSPLQAQDDAIQLGTGDRAEQTSRLGTSDSGNSSGSQRQWRGSGHHSHGISHGDHHSYGISGRPHNKLSPKPDKYHEKPRHHDRQDYGGIRGHISFGYSDSHQRYHRRQDSIPYSGFHYRDHQDTRVIYAPGYYREPNNLNSTPAITSYRALPAEDEERAYDSTVDPWSALADYQIHTARYAFEAQVQRSPHDALPRVGLALSTALAGDLDAGIFAMEDALRSDTSALGYFQADESLQLVIEELLLDYRGEPLMTASLHYLNRDYAAARQALEVAANYCQPCHAVDNLDRLIQQQI
jgi:hypothetical protein